MGMKLYRWFLVTALGCALVFAACDTAQVSSTGTAETPPASSASDNEIRVFYYESLLVLGRVNQADGIVETALPVWAPVSVVTSPDIIHTGLRYEVSRSWYFDDETGLYTAGYTIIARDGSRRDYTVYVTVPASGEGGEEE